MSSIASPTLWFVTIGVVLALLVVDFIATRRPHEVSMREAIGWSAFYVALPLTFGLYVWNVHGGDRGLEYYTGYLVEKTLSVDNLFVFMLLLAAFAVPEVLKAAGAALRHHRRARAARHLHRPRRGGAVPLRLGVPDLRRGPAAHRRQAAA